MGNKQNKDSQYIARIFNTSLSDGVKFEHNAQHIAKLHSSSCQLHLNASTLFGKTNQWKIQFTNCKYTYLRIDFWEHTANHKINKTLPDNLPSSFHIIVTLNRTIANERNTGWDELTVHIPCINSEISTQKRQFDTESLMMIITLISSSKCVIKAWQSINNINTQSTVCAIDIEKDTQRYPHKYAISNPKPNKPRANITIENKNENYTRDGYAFSIPREKLGVSNPKSYTNQSKNTHKWRLFANVTKRKKKSKTISIKSKANKSNPLAIKALYDRNILVFLVYGFIRKIENDYLDLKYKNQTIPVPIKDLILWFTDLFNKHCKYDVERSKDFRFETINNVCNAIAMKANTRLWMDGKIKFGEEQCWKIVFKDCEKHLLRIQFDNKEKMKTVHYDTIGKNIMSRPDKLIDLPNPFTVIVVLDRKDAYKNQYFIDDKDEEEIKQRKTKFGGWDRLKIKFIDIDYEMNAERPQLIDDLELNLSIMSSSHCVIQAWKGYVE